MCQRHRIHNCAVKHQSESFCILMDKSGIKRRIMSNDTCVSDKFQKSWKDFFYRRRRLHHRIRNRCKLRNRIRNRHFRIDKLGKRILNLSVFDPDSSNLNDPVVCRTKTCCLYVKHHIFRINALSFFVLYKAFDIIYKISFYAIDNLKIFAFFYLMICNRKRLHNAMICDCKCFHAPFFCAGNHLFDSDNTVHLTHHRM